MRKMYEEWWDDARRLLKQMESGVMTIEEFEEMAQMEINRS